MFKRLKLRIQDIHTISDLISGADRYAEQNGEDMPGAEHYLLSALSLPDGTAKQVFKRLNADPSKFQIAINKQYSDALNIVGVDTSVIEGEPEPISSSGILHNSKPSGQAVMKALYALKSHDKERPILGAHILEVISHMKYGVVARSLRTMGIDGQALHIAADDELAAYDSIR